MHTWEEEIMKVESYTNKFFLTFLQIKIISLTLKQFVIKVVGYFGRSLKISLVFPDTPYTLSNFTGKEGTISLPQRFFYLFLMYNYDINKIK